MDVQLFVAFTLSTLIFSALLIMLLFKARLISKVQIKFFQNDRYQKLTYFMYISLVLCILNLILIISNNEIFLPHIILSAILLLIFRKGIAK